MATTNFQSGTVIASAWLNDVNGVTYNKTFPDGTIALSTAPGSLIDATAVSYEEGTTGSGAVSRTVSNKLQESVSVLDFIPTSLYSSIQNGTNTTDLSGYINTAITSINNGTYAGKLFFPAGVYLIKTSLQLGTVTSSVARPLEIFGCGWGSQIVNQAPTNNPTFNFSGAKGWYIHDLLITGVTGNSNTGILVDGSTYGTQNWTIERITFYTNGVPLIIKSTNTGVISNCQTWPNNLNGALLYSTNVPTAPTNDACQLVGSFCNQILIQECNFLSTSSTYGIICSATVATGLTILGGDFESNTGASGAYGISLNNVYDSVIDGPYMENAILTLYNSTHNTVSGVTNGSVGGQITVTSNSIGNDFLNCRMGGLQVTDTASTQNTFIGCQFSTYNDLSSPANIYINDYNRTTIRSLFKNSPIITVNGPSINSFTPDTASGDTQIFNVTNPGYNFTINAPASTKSGWTNGYLVDGTRITYIIKNATGGSLGTITWSGYKMSTWTNPANGYNRSITFNYDAISGNWYQISQTGTDIPN